MIVDISDWESDDWDTTITEMLSWIESTGTNPDAVWPDRDSGILHFPEINNATEFILKWYLT